MKNGGSLIPTTQHFNWCVQCDTLDILSISPGSCSQRSLIRLEDGFLITQSKALGLTDKCFEPQDDVHVKVTLAPCNNNISDPSNDQLWSLRGSCGCSAYAGLWSSFTLYNIKRNMCLSYKSVFVTWHITLKECGITSFYSLPMCTLNSFIVGE